MATTGDIARSLHNLGYVAHAQGDEDKATALFTESLRIFQEGGQRRGLAEFLAGMAAVAAGRATERGDMQRAARLLGAAEAQFQAIGVAMWPADRLEHARTEAVVRGVLSEEGYAAASAEGRAMTLEQAIAYALEEPPGG